MNEPSIENIVIGLPPFSKKEYLDTESLDVKIRSDTIGKILKFLRNETRLTQKEVALKIGVAQQTYAGYESGKHEPSIELTIRLANLYKVTMDYITGRNFTILQEFDLTDEEKHWMQHALPQIQRQFETERAFTEMLIKQSRPS